LICPTAQEEFFPRGDWTGQITLKEFGKFVFWRNGDWGLVRRKAGDVGRETTRELSAVSRQIPRPSMEVEMTRRGRLAEAGFEPFRQLWITQKRYGTPESAK
jgi:hypothetical protein